RTLVTNPGRTVLVLVTDFCEGADPRVLRSTVRSMRSDGCKLIGLASLEEQGHLWFDEQMAQRLTADGMEIAAVTPNRLADWLAQVMSE
ncbi:MAG: VWA domain-containing protein, partial [Planctomycetota bacterium]